jgi:transposase-like protein
MTETRQYCPECKSYHVKLIKTLDEDYILDNNFIRMTYTAVYNCEDCNETFEIEQSG